jgi:hypothetical protein
MRATQLEAVGALADLGHHHPPNLVPVLQPGPCASQCLCYGHGEGHTGAPVGWGSQDRK